MTDRVATVPPERFNHGLTRNAAVCLAQGELVVLIVQDALPIGDSWLADLTAPMFADDRVAGTFSRQLARPDASAITRTYFERADAGRDRPMTFAPLTMAELNALPPMERLRRCALDNVCACIRRSVWQKIPFRETTIAEDLEWARDVLLAGHRLEFVSASCVFHSHERSASYEFARTYYLHRRLFELFELRTIPTLSSLARSVISCARLHLHCESRVPNRRVSAAFRAMNLALAWPLGQYLGALSASRHWKPLTLRERV
jgi:rhamnosyltransferase